MLQAARHAVRKPAQTWRSSNKTCSDRESGAEDATTKGKYTARGFLGEPDWQQRSSKESSGDVYELVVLHQPRVHAGAAGEAVQLNLLRLRLEER